MPGLARSRRSRGSSTEPTTVPRDEATPELTAVPNPTPEPASAPVFQPETAPEPTPEPAPESAPEPEVSVDTSEDTGKRGKSKAITDEDVQLDGGFVAVTEDEVPKIVRQRGRSNVFDDPIRESFEGEYKHLDKWVQGRVGNLEAAEKQARNAASYLADKEGLNLGVEIRRLPDNKNNPDGPGVLFFRGKPKREVTRTTS